MTDITAAIAFPTVQGPRSRELLAGLIPDADLAALKRWQFTWGHFGETRVMISRTGVTGELGFELFVPSDEAAGVWNGLLAVGRGLWVAPLRGAGDVHFGAGEAVSGAWH